MAKLPISVIPLCFIGGCLLLCGCMHRHREPEGITVFVSIPPQKYFVDKISGGRVTCLVMVPPGSSPHSYEPRPSQMSQLSSARAYFSIGVELEAAWLPRFVSLSKGLLVVPTDSRIEKIPMEPGITAPGAAHGPRRVGHGGLDPHIWLSPQLVKIQCASVADGLAAIDPGHAGEYRRNRDLFIRQCDSLHQEIKDVLLKGNGNKIFMVFHPSWGYFAREFGLTQLAIEVEGKEPGAREMQAIMDAARKNGIRTILVQPQFSRRAAAAIARELDASVADADPLAYDWADNLVNVAKEMAGQ
jgi:zinc transport system substrate-binding protein